MHFFTSLFPLFAVQAVAMVQNMSREFTERTCGAPPPSPEMRHVQHEMSLQPRDTPKEGIEVATYFHVVTTSEREPWVPGEMIAEQVRDSSAEYI